MGDSYPRSAWTEDLGCRNLFVRNLDWSVDNQVLEASFSHFGPIESAEVIRNADGKSKGYGFLLFESPEDAVKAMVQMQGKFLHSTALKIAMAHHQADRIPQKVGHVPNDRVHRQQDSRSEISRMSWSSEHNEELRLLRNHTNGVAERIRSLYTEELHTDVRFVVNTNRGMKQYISAHKAILAVGSPKFAEMLFTGAGHTADISICNISYEAFRNVIEYLYTDDVFFEDVETALEILRGAKQFGIQRLVDRCESFMESIEISEANACAVFQLAISNNIDDLKNRCATFIQENTADVLKSQGFVHCLPTTVRTIFRLQRLNLKSEGELFDAAVRWTEAQTKDTGSMRPVMEPLLKCIRFLTMSVATFSSLMKKYPNILTTTEILGIIHYLSNTPKPPDFSMLPSWCNKGENRFFAEVPAAPKSITGNNVTISLKPSNAFPPLSSLKCFLEMKCLNGRHQINAVNLCFQGPLTQESVIKLLILNISVSSSGFTIEERMRIENSISVTVTLSRQVLARPGDVVHIAAEALDIENYRFQQFDEQKSFLSNADFTCSLASLPKKDRLFFISEVVLAQQEKQFHRSQNFRR